MSDPSRKKMSYFELKPNERPSSKIESLKRQNKDLKVMLETCEHKLKEWISSAKKERVKLVDEMITQFTIFSKQNNAVIQAIGFLKKLRWKLDTTKGLTHLRLSNTEKINFESKHSNEYLTKNCSYWWRTKPSGSECSVADEDSLKGRIKSLEDEVLKLKTDNKSLNSQLQSISTQKEAIENEFNVEREVFQQHLALNKTLLKMFENPGQEVKSSEAIKIITECDQNKSTSGEYRSHHNSDDRPKEDPIEVPAFIRWLMADENMGPVVSNTPSPVKPKLVYEGKPSSIITVNRSSFDQNSSPKKTNFSMYRNAVKKGPKAYKPIEQESSGSFSESYRVDDGSVEKGNIPRMMIVSDMMDKSHHKGPMHLVFDLK